MLLLERDKRQYFQPKNYVYLTKAFYIHFKDVLKLAIKINF